MPISPMPRAPIRRKQAVGRPCASNRWRRRHTAVGSPTRAEASRPSVAQGVIQPVEHHLVLVGEFPGLAVVLRAVLRREGRVSLWTFQRVVNLLRLASAEHISLALHDKAGG